MWLLELIFGKSKHQDSIDYYTYLNSDAYKKAEEEDNMELQKIEDDRVQMALEHDASQMFLDWNFGKIFVCNPNNVGIYTIYHDNYRWKDNKTTEYKEKIFNKLKGEAIAKVDISHLNNFTEKDLDNWRIYQILERVEIEALKNKFNIKTI